MSACWITEIIAHLRFHPGVLYEGACIRGEATHGCSYMRVNLCHFLYAAGDLQGTNCLFLYAISEWAGRI